MSTALLVEKVKKVLEIQNNDSNAKIQSYLDSFCSKIKSVCNRADFPNDLDYMAVEYARRCFIYYKNKTTDNEQLQVTSATDNGQTVHFSTSETVTKSDVDINNYIRQNADEISMYAYMRW
ncbi:MAG: phage head-tail connector protein [Clostridia bacterium]|nr:phage head-tail connector protein [Clostridia bacterium]